MQNAISRYLMSFTFSILYTFKVNKKLEGICEHNHVAKIGSFHETTKYFG